MAEAAVTKEINHKPYIFGAARNQADLNQYCPLVTLGWLANTDLQPSTSLFAVVEYIGKYISKAEKSSISYADIVKISPHMNSRAPVLSLTAKLLNKLVDERDYSAQEVSHILLRLDMQHASRQVVGLNCRPQDEMVTVEGHGMKKGQSPCEHYLDRTKPEKNGRPELFDVLF
jgi:hypothetical protein